MSIFGCKKRISMDYASTTPVDRRVVAIMKPFFSEKFSNPSSLYKEGVEARKVVNESRKKVAEILAVQSEDILFTASGTEANNLVLLGIFRAVKKKDFIPHIITTAIEHPSVLEVCKQIEKEGGVVTLVPVSENGIVDPKEIARALRPETILVTVMYANNEIGTIQPITEIGRVIRAYRKNSAIKNGYPFFHTDASQAANYLSLKIDTLGVDALTLDASKIYGPKGVGMLFIKRTIPIESIVFGGGQERGLRAGTENVPGIVGAAKALEIATKLREAEVSRLIPLRDYFIYEVLKKFPNVKLNGDAKMRLPNNINICFPGINAEFAVIQLDEAGVCVTSASACKNLTDDSASYVIEAIHDLSDQGKECAQSSLRFSLGRSTTKREIKKVLSELSKIIFDSNLFS